MKQDKDIFITFIAIGFAILAVLFAWYIIGLRSDNYIEEMAENVIEKRTGYDIDLSPNSPEKIDADYYALNRLMNNH